MKRLVAGWLGLIASVATLASPPAFPACAPDEIRYSLLLRERDAGWALQQGWRRVPLTAAQAEDLPLGGETEMSMAELLAGYREPRPTLLTRCWSPAPRGDLDAYAATLSEVVAAAQATRALAVGDGETQEWLQTREFNNTLLHGQAAPYGKARVSKSNPPAMSFMGGAFTIGEQDEGGYRTRGLRKLGLPELSLEAELSGYSFIVFMQALGDLALSGRLPLQPDVAWDLPLDDPVVRMAARPTFVSSLKLRWRQVHPSPTPLLRLELADAPGKHPFEQQMLIADALWGSPYAVLGPERARELGQAVARAKLNIIDLHTRWPSIRAEGGRLWVHADLAAVAREVASERSTLPTRWYEVVASDGRSHLALRRWEGDPRAGGTPVRDGPSIAVGERTEGPVHLFLVAPLAEDWLVQDAQGRFTAGEPMNLLMQWHRLRPVSPSPP